MDDLKSILLCVPRMGHPLVLGSASSPGQTLCILLTWYWVTGANFLLSSGPPLGMCLPRGESPSLPASWNLLEPPGLSRRRDWGTIGGCVFFGLSRDYF